MKCRRHDAPITMTAEVAPSGLLTGYTCPACGAVVLMRDVGYAPPVSPPAVEACRVTFTREELTGLEPWEETKHQQQPDAKAKRSAAYRAGLAKKAATLEPRLCQCGCGTTFPPTTVRHWYVTKAHRAAHDARLERERRDREQAQAALRKQEAQALRERFLAGSPALAPEQQRAMAGGGR